MRGLFIFILCLCGFFCSCNSVDENNVHKSVYVRDENYEEIADKITHQVAFKLRQEKGLRCIGIGGGMMSDIQRMGMSFQFFQEVDLIEARKLLVSVVSEYLTAINSSKEVRPYLHDYPFQSKNIEIRIWIRKSDGYNVNIGEIDYICAIDAVLRYDVANILDNYENHYICKETYEEALKIIHEQEVASHTQAS